MIVYHQFYYGNNKINESIQVNDIFNDQILLNSKDSMNFNDDRIDSKQDNKQNEKIDDIDSSITGLADGHALNAQREFENELKDEANCSINQTNNELIDKDIDKTKQLVSNNVNHQLNTEDTKLRQNTRPRLELKRSLAFDSYNRMPSKRLKLSLKNTSSVQNKTKTSKEIEGRNDDNHSNKISSKTNSNDHYCASNNIDSNKADQFSTEIAQIEEWRKQIESLPVQEESTGICMSELELVEKMLLDKIKLLKIRSKQLNLMRKINLKLN